MQTPCTETVVSSSRSEILIHLKCDALTVNISIIPFITTLVTSSTLAFAQMLDRVYEGNAIVSISRYHTKQCKLLLNDYCYTIGSLLPMDVRKCKNYATFNGKVKAYLIMQYTD